MKNKTKNILIIISVVVALGLILTFGISQTVIYSSSVTKELSGSNRFTSVSKYNTNGWIDNGSCSYVNSNGRRFDRCSKTEQSYNYLTNICLDTEPKNAQIKFYYTFTNVNVFHKEGSSTQGYAELFGKNENGEFISLGKTDNLYAESDHVGQKYYYTHTSPEISNAFNGECLEVYVGNYWWFSSDGESATITLNKADIVWNPLLNITVYTLDNNQCNKKTIKEDDVGENDFITLSQCEMQLVKVTEEPPTTQEIIEPVVVEEKTPFYFYIFPVVIIGLITLIIWGLRKKPKRKKR